MSFLDYCIIISYILVVMFVGIWFWFKRDRSMVAFMAAKNSMKGWVLGCSLVVTGMSSLTLLGKPGKAYAADWGFFVYTLAVPIAAFIAIRYFIPFYRKSGDCSAFTHLERRFGIGAMIYATVSSMIAAVIWIAAILYLMSIALENIMGIEGRNAIFLVGVVGMIYTSIGGIKSVIWTDVIQCFLLVTGILLTLIYLIQGIPGGVNDLVHIAIENQKFNLGSFSLDFTKATFWVFLLGGVLRTIYWLGITPETVQRYVAADSDKEGKKSLIIHLILYFFFSAMLFLIGTALFVFYKTNPALTTEAMADMPNDAIYPFFIANTLPAGVKGIMIAAILAAGMSSIDSGLNANGMLCIENIYKPLAKKYGRLVKLISPWKLLYWTPIVCGIASICIALKFADVENVLDEWYKLETIFASGVLGVFLLGRFSKEAGPKSALAGILAGALVVAWMVFSPSWTGSWEPYSNKLHPFTTMFVGALSVIAVGLLARCFSRSRNQV